MCNLCDNIHYPGIITGHWIFDMNRIKYKVNSGHIQYDVTCEILQETATELVVLINGELERTIKKTKIISNETI